MSSPVMIGNTGVAVVDTVAQRIAAETIGRSPWAFLVIILLAIVGLLYLIALYQKRVNFALPWPLSNLKYNPFSSLVGSTNIQNPFRWAGVGNNYRNDLSEQANLQRQPGLAGFSSGPQFWKGDDSLLGADLAVQQYAAADLASKLGVDSSSTSPAMTSAAPAAAPAAPAVSSVSSAPATSSGTVSGFSYGRKAKLTDHDLIRAMGN